MDRPTLTSKLIDCTSLVFRFPKGKGISPSNIATKLTSSPLDIVRYLLHVFPFKASDAAGSARKGKRDSAGGFDDETRIPSSEHGLVSGLVRVLKAFPIITAATYLSGKLERLNHKSVLQAILTSFISIVGHGSEQCNDVPLQTLSRMLQDSCQRELMEQGHLHVVSTLAGSKIQVNLNLTRFGESVRKLPAWQS